MITHLTSYRPTVRSLSRDLTTRFLERHPNLDLARSILKDTFFTKRLRSPAALDKFLQSPQGGAAKIKGRVFEDAGLLKASITIPEGKELLIKGKNNSSYLNIMVKGTLRAFNSFFNIVNIAPKGKASIEGAKILENKGWALTWKDVGMVDNQEGAKGYFLGKIYRLSNFGGEAHCYGKVQIADNFGGEATFRNYVGEGNCYKGTQVFYGEKPKTRNRSEKGEQVFKNEG